MRMKPSDLKPHVLASVKRAASVHSAVKFRDVSAAMPAHGVQFDFRDLDRALQALRREKAIEYIGSRDPKTGKTRKRWGWQPVATPVSRKGARRG